MGKVRALSREYETVDLMVRDVLERYTEIRHGIVIVFDSTGTMRAHYAANAPQMALAAAYLARRATEGLVEHGPDDEGVA